MREEVKSWWNLALDDLDKADILYRNKKYDGAAFYCQQSVEKALKALLLKKVKKIRKIHDLVALGIDAELPENLLNAVKELTMAYIYSRYPDVKQEMNLKEKTTHLLKISKEVLEWVKEKL
jgi:HEPN domain-containing protein